MPDAMYNLPFLLTVNAFTFPELIRPVQFIKPSSVMVALYKLPLKVEMNILSLKTAIDRAAETQLLKTLVVIPVGVMVWRLIWLLSETV